MHLFDLLAFVIAGFTYWSWPKNEPGRAQMAVATGFLCWFHLNVWFLIFVCTMWGTALVRGHILSDAMWSTSNYILSIFPV